LANDHWAQSVRDSIEANKAHGESIDATSKGLINYNANIQAAKDSVIKLSAELAKWSEENDKLLGTQDPITKA